MIAQSLPINTHWTAVVTNSPGRLNMSTFHVFTNIGLVFWFVATICASPDSPTAMPLRIFVHLELTKQSSSREKKFLHQQKLTDNWGFLGFWLCLRVMWFLKDFRFGQSNWNVGQLKPSHTEVSTLNMHLHICFGTRFVATTSACPRPIHLFCEYEAYLGIQIYKDEACNNCVIQKILASIMAARKKLFMRW